jgi:hypothetical protein
MDREWTLRKHNRPTAINSGAVAPYNNKEFFAARAAVNSPLLTAMAEINTGTISVTRPSTNAIYISSGNSPAGVKASLRILLAMEGRKAFSAWLTIRPKE